MAPPNLLCIFRRSNHCMTMQGCECRTFFSKPSSEKSKTDSSNHIDPLKAYTIFGNLRSDKKDVFHYTDRKSGAGYSHYASNLYQHRPYIWPPLRKLYSYNYLVIAVGLCLLCFDFDWLMRQLKQMTESMRPKASQMNEGEPDNSSDLNSKRKNPLPVPDFPWCGPHNEKIY